MSGRDRPKRPNIMKSIPIKCPKPRETKKERIYRIALEFIANRGGSGYCWEQDVAGKALIDASTDLSDQDL